MYMYAYFVDMFLYGVNDTLLEHNEGKQVGICAIALLIVFSSVLWL